MQPPSLTSLRRVAAVLAVMLAALVLTTLAVAALEGALRIPDASATYLLAVVSVAVVFGTPAAVATAFGSFLLYDFLFVSPTGALFVSDPEELLNLLLLLALGIVVGQLAGMQRARAETALLRERQARTQYRVGRELATATTTRSALPALVRIIAAEVEAPRAWIGLGPDVGQERVVADSDPAARPLGSTSYELLQRNPDDDSVAWVRVHDARVSSFPARDPGGVTFRCPIAAGGIPLGSLWVVRRRADGPPGRSHTRLLAALRPTRSARPWSATASRRRRPGRKSPAAARPPRRPCSTPSPTTCGPRSPPSGRPPAASWIRTCTWTRAPAAPAPPPSTPRPRGATAWSRTCST